MKDNMQFYYHTRYQDQVILQTIKNKICLQVITFFTFQKSVLHMFECTTLYDLICWELLVFQQSGPM